MTGDAVEAGGEVRVTRTHDAEHQVLLAEGSFEPFFDAYLEHARRWGIEPDPLAYTMMRQGLAGAVLHLCCRPRDEIGGWTINFHDLALNIFITGDAGACTVAGRVFTEGVKTVEESRLFVQSHRPGMEPLQTVVDFEGYDVLDVFERYYSLSEQHPARFFDCGDGRFVLLLGFPGADAEWIRSLDRGDALKHLKRSHQALDDRVFRFACGCTAEKMKEVIDLVFEEDPGRLFDDDEDVEVQCPRCGHHWVLKRPEV